jgi:hypothetical protein
LELKNCANTSIFIRWLKGLRKEHWWTELPLEDHPSPAEKGEEWAMRRISGET